MLYVHLEAHCSGKCHTETPSCCSPELWRDFLGTHFLDWVVVLAPFLWQEHSLVINIRVDVQRDKMLLWTKTYQMQTEETVVVASFHFLPTVVGFFCSTWNSNGNTCLCDYYQWVNSVCLSASLDSYCMTDYCDLKTIVMSKHILYHTLYMY